MEMVYLLCSRPYLRSLYSLFHAISGRRFGRRELIVCSRWRHEQHHRSQRTQIHKATTSWQGEDVTHHLVPGPNLDVSIAISQNSISSRHTNHSQEGSVERTRLGASPAITLVRRVNFLSTTDPGLTVLETDKFVAKMKLRV